MKLALIFSLTLVAMNAGASVAYAFASDARHALYFAFAAGITVTVIWR